MGRRGFVSTLIRIERAARRAKAAQARAGVRAQREAERNRLLTERYRLVFSAKEQKRAYIEARMAEAEDQNKELEQTVAALGSVLGDTFGRSVSGNFETLKEPLTDEPYHPGILAKPLPAPELAKFLPPRPSWIKGLVPGAKAKHEHLTNDARQRFQAETTAHSEAEKQRQAKLEEVRAAHEAKVIENRRRVDAQHAEVEELKRGFQARSDDAVAAYFALVLGQSEYPENFPCIAELIYQPEAKKLVVDMELPAFDVAPEAGSFRYVKSKDRTEQSPRSVRERRALYASVITQIALRTLHEVFSADKVSQTVDTVLFNGHVSGIDPGTGQKARPCVVTVQASPDVLANFDLRRVEPAACLSALHGVISKSPEELIPVEPIHDFNVVDPRFRKTVKA